MSAVSEPIRYTWKALSEQEVSAFESATASEFTRGNPPTMATIFRWGEFQWLEQNSVDLRQLLHTDQEYEYLKPLPVGQPFTITTQLSEVKQKAKLKFVSLHSEILCGTDVLVRSFTKFVIRAL